MEVRSHTHTSLEIHHSWGPWRLEIMFKMQAHIVKLRPKKFLQNATLLNQQPEAFGWAY